MNKTGIIPHGFDGSSQPSKKRMTFTKQSPITPTAKAPNNKACVPLTSVFSRIFQDLNKLSDMSSSKVLTPSNNNPLYSPRNTFLSSVKTIFFQ